MGGHYAVDDLAGANPGIENVTYGFPRALLSIRLEERI
jgi:hypothetical protein